ncbi:MAG: hypothetical protein KIT83_08295 [Bryobacterales bacterium]|nr:hypothetical protein [Bryobacterales bacterium]
MTTARPKLTATIQVSKDAVAVAYEFENVTGETVLLYDRLWSMANNALEDGWAYVEIRGTKALLKRALEPKPEGLMTDTPPVPYARPVPPGEKATGSFSVSLPLTRRSAYGSKMTAQQSRQVPVTVEELAFAVGWSLQPSKLPPYVKPVDIGEDKGMLLLSYETVLPIQRILLADPIRSQVPGIVSQ